MKYTRITPLIALYLLAACSKDDDNGQTCKVISMERGQTITEITYNESNLLNPPYAAHIRYFNDNTLAESVQDGDEVALDDAGRLSRLNLPWGNGGRQVRSYEYNAEGEVTRTHTNTGNGTDYHADLVWEHGDMVAFSYNIAGAAPGNANYYYSYYDNPSRDQYHAMMAKGQVGVFFNRHLLKRSVFRGDTAIYSYKLDSTGRVREMYSERIGSPRRYVDTSYFHYRCS